MNIHLLIVDDEKLTKDGLTHYIDWNSLGITMVKSASSAQEALDITKSFLPDILLTDVKMPHMTGIELAYHIREKLPECKIVFLSGYADKEYLKSAIDLKAETYIEKPVVLNTVSLVLSKVIQAVKKEKEARLETVLQKNTLSETRSIINIEIVQNLVSPRLNLERFKKKFMPMYFTWQDNSLYTAVCIYLHTGLDFVSGKQICFQLDNYLLENHIFQENEYFIGLVSGNCPLLITSVVFSSVLNSALARIQDYLKEELALTCTISVGPSVQTLEEISESYRTASDAYAYYRMYCPYQPVIECHFPISKKPAPEALFSLKNYSRSALTELFETLKKERFTNISFIREKLYEIYSLTAPRLSDTPLIPWEQFCGYSLQDYTQLLCCGTSDLENQTQIESYKGSVKKAVHFMMANYMNSGLTIKQIADEVGLSPNYFCSLFKQEVKMTPNDYLLNIRMEKVCFYLKNTNLKLYEISGKVGIPDANYLNTLFKKSFGKTPTQYRKDIY